MRLVTFQHQGYYRIGAITGEQVVDLNFACEAMFKHEGKLRAKQLAEAYVPADMVAFLQGGDESQALAQKAMAFVQSQVNQVSNKIIIHNRTEVRIEAPVLTPDKILCVGLNYRDHILEMGRELPEHPVVFAKFNNTIVGPEDNIPHDPITKQLDYEAEFSFVMGKRARNVKAEDALDYVAGYTIVNDVTARDLQRRTIQWLQGKTLDGSAPMGPWLITKDEVPNPDDLEMVLKVNGEERQHTNTKQLVFNVNKLVEFFSGIMTLEPGDVICTGTPGGVGFARNPQVFLHDGDVVHIEIQGIGVLENQVKAVKEEQI
jgi:acylpyruvate hydrolase